MLPLLLLLLQNGGRVRRETGDFCRFSKKKREKTAGIKLRALPFSLVSDSLCKGTTFRYLPLTSLQSTWQYSAMISEWLSSQRSGEAQAQARVLGSASSYHGSRSKDA